VRPTGGSAKIPPGPAERGGNYNLAREIPNRQVSGPVPVCRQWSACMRGHGGSLLGDPCLSSCYNRIARAMYLPILSFRGESYLIRGTVVPESLMSALMFASVAPQRECNGWTNRGRPSSSVRRRTGRLERA